MSITLTHSVHRQKFHFTSSFNQNGVTFWQVVVKCLWTVWADWAKNSHCLPISDGLFSILQKESFFDKNLFSWTNFHCCERSKWKKIPSHLVTLSTDRYLLIAQFTDAENLSWTFSEKWNNYFFFFFSRVFWNSQSPLFQVNFGRKCTFRQELGTCTFFGNYFAELKFVL